MILIWPNLDPDLLPSWSTMGLYEREWQIMIVHNIQGQLLGNSDEM